MHFVFQDKEGFQRMLEFAETHDRVDPWKPTEEMGVLLVKDDGAYVMAPTVQKDLNKSEDGSPVSGCHVIYAKGCRPEDGHIGGDDFAEFIPLNPKMCEHLKGGGTLSITLTDTSMDIETSK